MTRARVTHVVAAALMSGTAATLGGCDDGSLGPDSAPELISFSVTPGVGNALQVDASVVAQHADSVNLALVPQGDAQGPPIVTPAATLINGSAVVTALGLHPERRYSVRAILHGGGRTTSSEPRDVLTGRLPSDLPSFVAAGDDPSPGYVVFAAGNYGLIIDNTGRVVWYHNFPRGAGLNFAPQPNGRFVAMPVSTSGPGPWVEISPSGEMTRSLGCASGLRPRLHDLIAQPDGSYWLLCDETRTMDLTSLGGVPAAHVTGTVVQHVASTGEALFQWSPFDHFSLADADPDLMLGPAVNWTHGNSLDLDQNGDLVVSFRNLDEITGIDTRTGAVQWRLGGRRNTFSLGTGATYFAQQHSARVLDGGRILLLDNLGDPAESRAELWSIDKSTNVARLLQSHGSVPPVRTLIGGSVQFLPNERALVSFGTVGRVEEYDAAGEVVWRIVSGAGYVFRATRIRSLYHPELGLSR